jgi:hypothetical protein
MIWRFLIYALMPSILFAAGCSCQQSDFKALASPDGRYVLIERETDCGATDPFGTTLSIQSQRPRFGVARLGFPNKQVFAADVRIRPNTQIRWLDNYNVEVVCTGCEKYGVATKITEWRDVKIHYDVGNTQKGVF